LGAARQHYTGTNLPSHLKDVTHDTSHLIFYAYTREEEGNEEEEEGKEKKREFVNL
jgi:hypothetical protein